MRDTPPTLPDHDVGAAPGEVESAYAWTRLLAALLLSTIGGVGSGYASILSCWKAIRPPTSTATNNPTIK